MMTRETLYDWVIAHGCEVDMKEGINAGYNPNVRLYNPRTKGKAILATPINESTVSTYLVYKVCTLLGIEIPECAVAHKETSDQIDSHLKRSK